MTQRPPPGPADGPADHFFARLLAADAGPLPPFDPAPLSVASLTPTEAAALAAALGCPDLFLIDAPGHDRGRLAADLAAEAARAGRRVLVVAPAADAVVDRLAALGESVGRAVAPGEVVELLTRAAAGRTAAALGEAAVADAHRRAAHAVAAAEARVAGLNAEGISERSVRVDADEAAARADRDRADADAERCPEVAGLLARHAAELSDRDAAVRAAEAARAAKAEVVAKLRAELDEAVTVGKKRPGAVGFFKGLLTGDDSAARCGDLQRRLAAEEEAAAALAAEAERATAARAGLEPIHRTHLEALIRAEAHRRRAAADVRAADLAAERVRLAELAAAVRAAEAEVRAARDRAAGIDARAADLASEALARVRVVVGPTAAVGADPFVPVDTTFDLLVAADAEHLSEPDLGSAARLAGRWVLIGDAGAPARPGRAPAAFPRAWQQLHRRAFAAEGGRFVARLFDAPRQDRLRAEPLADRPQIELRFARTPDGGVGVAEVTFPANTPLTAAKTFLAAELGEVRLAVSGPVRWHEADDRLTACWPSADGLRGGGWADLGDGVRERVAGTGPDAPTAMVSFDPAAGWDRASAEAWVARHAAEARAHRTAALPRPAEVAAPVRALAAVGG